MARFDVFRLTTGDLAIDCQSDFLDNLATRLTVPLMVPDRVAAPVSGLHPTFEIEGVEMVMATHLAGAIPVRVMQAKIGSLADQQYVVQRALDTLTGSY